MTAIPTLACATGGSSERSPFHDPPGIGSSDSRRDHDLGWRLLDGQIDAATVEGPLHGVTYAPWAKDQDPIEAKSSGVWSFLRTAFTDAPPPVVKPRKEQIERDFAMLAGKVNYVRTYRAVDGGDIMPEIAARYGLKLVPGAWIYSANEAKQQFGREAGEVNAEETRALIRMANQNPNIERVLVGNENILRWDGQKDLRDPNATSPAQLIREIRNVKRNVKVPVSTAEPWHVWLHYPELAREVDYLAVHILPYWDEKSDEAPLDYLKSRIAMLKEAEYPNKNIIVTEVGWPSNGAARRSPGSGVVKYATPAEQAKNVRDAVAWLRSQNIDHFVVEAVDQPWKSYDLEGKAGGYWGLWNADRQPKFAWTGPVERFPQWCGLRGLVAGGVAAADAAVPVALARRSARRDRWVSAAWWRCRPAPWSTAPRLPPAPTCWSPRWWAGPCSPSSWC